MYKDALYNQCSDGVVNCIDILQKHNKKYLITKKSLDFNIHDTFNTNIIYLYEKLEDPISYVDM